MIYVCFKGKRVLGITNKFPYTGTAGVFTPHVPEGTTRIENHHDWKGFDQAKMIALKVTTITGDTYTAVDNGEKSKPRYDIVAVPKVGDLVTRAFNGDYTPDGTVVRVTKQFQVTTSSGRKYRRQGNTAKWLSENGGTWSLIPGHISERNPSF